MKAKQQEEFKRDWVGVCEVVTGEKAAKFLSVDTNKEGKVKTFSNGATELRINLSELPKEAQRVIKPNMKAGNGKKFRIRLNSDGNEVKTVTPVSGVFPAKLTGLVPKTQDGAYKLIEKVYNKGESNENSHLEFLAIYSITEGVFRGVELPGFYLHYKFEGVPEGEEDEGFTRFDTVDTPQASQLHKLQQWAEVHGNILDEPIVWSDDGIILDVLEERALDADRPVNLIFEKGYIKSVQPVEDYEDADEEVDFSDPDVEKELTEEDEVDKAFPKESVVVEKKPKGSSKATKTAAKKVSKAEEVDDDGDDL